MLQNRAIAPTIASPVSTELADSLERTLADERLRVIKRTFSLPDSLRSFLVFLLLLSLICAALIAHLMLATSLHKSELRLLELQTINRAIEQENTILIQQIAEKSSLAEGMSRAQQLGYEKAYERHFIRQGASSIVSVDAATPADGLAEQLP